MSDTVIKVENLSKRYILNHQHGGSYTALRDVLAQGVKDLGARIRSPFDKSSRATAEEFFALNNISLEIKQGDRVGIIGRNGAGKSTLLKILSRITEPTQGRIEITGRVASLLEVGTGFHPELTGRENIYLNGAILGMSRVEIKSKFDEIVTFAEIEKFLDTPVKRYSSGMYVRLAFSVAAHLQPDILIVDEVLAVGDAQFQKKCIGKMSEVSKEGRTVLFVSHNMGAISHLCTTGILLSGGEIVRSGEMIQVVNAYMANNSSGVSSRKVSDCKTRTGTRKAVFEVATIENVSGVECAGFSIGDDLSIRFGIRLSQEIIGRALKLKIELKSADGIFIANIVDVDSNFHIECAKAFEDICIAIKDIRLYPNIYTVSLWAGNSSCTETYDYIADWLSFEIIGGGRFTSRNLPRTSGIIFMTPDWLRG